MTTNRNGTNKTEVYGENWFNREAIPEDQIIPKKKVGITEIRVISSTPSPYATLESLERFKAEQAAENQRNIARAIAGLS